MLLCSFDATKTFLLFIWGTEPSLYTLPSHPCRPSSSRPATFGLSFSFARSTPIYTYAYICLLLSFFFLGGGAPFWFLSRAGSSSRQQRDGRAVPHKAYVGASADDRVRLARNYLNEKKKDESDIIYWYIYIYIIPEPAARGDVSFRTDRVKTDKNCRPEGTARYQVVGC